MIELQGNELVFKSPEVHRDATCRLGFQRTLRIPDDNRDYPLPAGLGRFPLEHVRHHANRVPQDWNDHGGVLLPMFQAEAMWVQFPSGRRRDSAYPFAIKIAAGKINAITGEPWRDALSDQPQDYVTTPGQPWIDGFCVQKGMIRQFVAMPLGQGYTAEEQITGAAEHGSLQIVAYPMKRERYEQLCEERQAKARAWLTALGIVLDEMPEPPTPSKKRKHDIQPSMKRPRQVDFQRDTSMGLAPGGLMRQEIYADKFGIDAWDQASPSRCFVHILNSEQWQTVTGKPTPGNPPNAAAYERAGLPWFEYYGDGENALEGADPLAWLDSVAAMDVKKGHKPQPDNVPIQPTHTVALGPKARTVDDGRW